MFEEESYQCITIREVYEELTRTTKFKSKYPWAAALRNKLKSLPAGITNAAAVAQYAETIRVLADYGTVDEKTGHLFNLSRIDIRVMACALGLGYAVTSGDAGLVRFLEQQFPNDYKGNISPLGIINIWLEKGLITWDETKQAIVAEWNASDEHPQPKADILKFKKLSSFPYPGP